MFPHSVKATEDLMKYEMLSVTLLLTTKARGVSLESRVEVRGQTCTHTHYTTKSAWIMRRLMISSLMFTHTRMLMLQVSTPLDGATYRQHKLRFLEQGNSRNERACQNQKKEMFS